MGYDIVGSAGAWAERLFEQTKYNQAGIRRKHNHDCCCNQAWLLKKSIFLKTGDILGIENVYPNRESRL
jgi:hypothetical protein